MGGSLKIILTGATGFVGGEALAQLLTDSSVDEVTCLVRRELEIASPKLKTVILKDFTSYDDALAEELARHDGCVWALGGKASDLGTLEFEKITTTFVTSFVDAVAPHLDHAFRFCYLSGMGADPTESTRFPWENSRGT